MRVGVATYRFPLLSETFVLDHVRRLTRDGICAGVVADPGEPGLLDVADAEDRRICEQIQSVAVRRPIWRRRTETLLAGLRSPSISWESIWGHRHRRRANDLSVGNVVRAGEGLRRLGDLDVLHCHFGPVGARFMEALAGGKDCPALVTTFHGRDVGEFPRDQCPPIYTALLRDADLLICVSEHLRQRVLSWGVDEERVTVQSLGVDLDRFRPREATSDSDRVRLLSIARLVEKKGLVHGVRAVAMLISRGVPVEYTILGSGRLSEQLEHEVATLGIGANVKFLGAQPPAVVRNALREHDILLAPSVTAASGDEEGVPVTIMEAMATGLPVVSTYHGGIPELITNGTTGLLVEERDEEGLAEALQILVQDPDQREKLGRAARCAMEASRDAERCYESLLAKYRELTHARTRTSSGYG